MSHVYPDPIQGPNSPVAKSFPYQPMPYCPTAEIPQISLRCYFAAAALQGLIASRGSMSTRFLAEDDASYVFEIADAMLKAREVKP